MTFISLVVIGLAVWRMASLLVNEEGPWGIFEFIRNRAGVRHDKYGAAYGQGELGEIFLCVWCMSVYLGIIATVAFVVLSELTFWLSLPLALSAIAILVEEIINEKGRPTD